MKTLLFIFPIKFYLTILQLEEYDLVRYLKWVIIHYTQRDLPEKKKLVVTTKIKLILIVSLIMLLSLFSYLNIKTGNFSFPVLISLILLTQPFILLSLATLLIKPYEYFKKRLIINQVRKMILSNSNLKVIAITGSYGKTSVKEILYQLIKDKFKTLRTPESFNTIFGISKMLKYEYSKEYELFICEMAAYKKGDISKLCWMVPPTYGVITGITTQHLERFGNLKNIIKTKFELYDCLNDSKKVIFNLQDSNVQSEVSRRHIINPKGYLVPSKVTFDKSGSTVTFIYNKKQYQVHTNLFGISNVNNLLGAISIAIFLGIDINYLLAKVGNLKPINNRFVLNRLNNCVVIDNTFSTNEISFRETIETARSVQGRKVLITPGLVELGKIEEIINEQVGELANSAFDTIILVGKNRRTQAFAKKITSKVKFINDKREDYLNEISDLSHNVDWIFLENDLPQNY